jgi:hypothetical protein
VILAQDHVFATLRHEFSFALTSPTFFHVDKTAAAVHSKSAATAATTTSVDDWLMKENYIAKSLVDKVDSKCRTKNQKKVACKSTYKKSYIIKDFRRVSLIVSPVHQITTDTRKNTENNVP